MKSLQLSALKSAERFVLAELATREKSYLPNPTEAEQRELSDAVETKQIIQAAIVDGELQPDLRVEMLAALKASKCWCLPNAPVEGLSVGWKECQRCSVIRRAER